MASCARENLIGDTSTDIYRFLVPLDGTLDAHVKEMARLTFHTFSLFEWSQYLTSNLVLFPEP